MNKAQKKSMATQSDVKRLSRRKKKHRNGRKYT